MAVNQGFREILRQASDRGTVPTVHPWLSLCKWDWCGENDRGSTLSICRGREREREGHIFICKTIMYKVFVHSITLNNTLMWDHFKINNPSVSVQTFPLLLLCPRCTTLHYVKKREKKVEGGKKSANHSHMVWASSIPSLSKGHDVIKAPSFVNHAIKQLSWE